MESEFTDVKEVLDGADMNQDLHQMIGYLWALGMKSDESTVFPSGYLAHLAEEFLLKHRDIKNQ